MTSVALAMLIIDTTSTMLAAAAAGTGMEPVTLINGAGFGSLAAVIAALGRAVIKCVERLGKSFLEKIDGTNARLTEIRADQRELLDKTHDAITDSAVAMAGVKDAISHMKSRHEEEIRDLRRSVEALSHC